MGRNEFEDVQSEFADEFVAAIEAGDYDEQVIRRVMTLGILTPEAAKVAQQLLEDVDAKRDHFMALPGDTWGRKEAYHDALTGRTVTLEQAQENTAKSMALAELYAAQAKVREWTISLGQREVMLAKTSQ